MGETKNLLMDVEMNTLLMALKLKKVTSSDMHGRVSRTITLSTNVICFFFQYLYYLASSAVYCIRVVKVIPNEALVVITNFCIIKVQECIKVIQEPMVLVTRMKMNMRCGIQLSSKENWIAFGTKVSNLLLFLFWQCIEYCTVEIRGFFVLSR